MSVEYLSTNIESLGEPFMDIENDIVITNGLLRLLENNFGSHLVHSCDTWEQTCELKGQLKVLYWLKDKQEELREEQFKNTEQININTS
jgi:GTP:adenosylcobinamide-phosphate guanylyltransferase